MKRLKGEFNLKFVKMTSCDMSLILLYRNLVANMKMSH